MLSVISSSSRRAVDARALEQPRDLDGELRVQERAGREVDGDAQLLAVVVPHAHLAQRLLEHVRGERADQAGLLGDRHELGRADEAEPRVLPAGQGLDADDGAGRELGLGLEVEDDLAVGDRRAQRAGERQAARAVAVELLLEHQVAAATLLGGVHRDVGALDELLDSRAVLGRAGDADAGVDLERQALDRERLAQLGEQPLGDGAGLVMRGQVGDQDAELVAAEAGDHLVLLERQPQSLGDLLQETVAGVMAERVVDLLEVIEVDQHDGRRTIRTAAGVHDLLDLVAEQRSVW